MHQNECLAAICVAESRAIGHRRAMRLLEAYGSFESVAAAREADLAARMHCSIVTARRMKRSMASVPAKRLLSTAKRAGGGCLSVSLPEYPALLREICDPPTVLWYRGDPSVLSKPSVGVVGARRCSADAGPVIGRFVNAFAEAGFVIVSGGARGIDAFAHRAAMTAGIPTISVLGSGFDHPYPPEHEVLFDEIIDGGGLVLSEYAAAVAPRPAHFPARNRIVAGLCIAILVHEAGARSGALITARLAAEDYGRDVMVVPGTVLDGRSLGSHRAVREGWAMLVDTPEDAVERLFESHGLLSVVCSAMEKQQS